MTRSMLKMRKEAGTNSTDVPAAEWFRNDSAVLSALTHVNCQFIRIIAEDNEGERHEALVDRRPHFTQLSADGGDYDSWSNDNLMLSKRKRDVTRSRGRLGSLWYWLERLAREPQEASFGGPFRNYDPAVEGTEPLQQLPSGSSYASRASVEQARRRAFRLAVYRNSENDDDSISESSDDSLDENGNYDDNDGGSMCVRGKDFYVGNEILRRQ
jgi:hypothetical protein